ncbi:UDP-2,4-diacetamido-2,4,6-trideoxy-beta-L-altropyranose hydrolase [Sporosarcina sp. ITBMC105]
MNVVIRTDASITIGTGHVVRCLTLANQLKRHGAQVTFVCRILEGDSITYLQSQGIRVLTLTSIDGHYDWQLDAEETIKILKEMDDEVDLIIVDHYKLDCRWESELRQYTRSIMVIDDLADRSHNCDLLLDQNYYSNAHERYKGLVPDHCVLMLGPDYVLLREEFFNLTNEPRKRTGEINNILVFFGGTDPTGETIKVLEAIKDFIIPEINVIVGSSNPMRYEIEQICRSMPNTTFHCQVNNMAELMWKADLAIGAGGATTWERCFLSLPSITVVIAENQLELTRTIAKEGATIYLGKVQALTKENYQKSIMKSIQNPESMKVMSRKCMELLNVNEVRKSLVTKKVLELLV